MAIDKITIYKIKSTATAIEEFVTVGGLQDVTLPGDVNCPETVTAWACMKTHSGKKKTQDNIPWLTFLNDGLPADKRFVFEATNSFPAGLVIFKFDKAGSISFYALTFGLAGDSLINHEYVVRDFGLRVAMNICDPSKLKRIQTSIHESVSTQSERQISVGSSFSVFNIDDEKEFLRTVAGTARNGFSFVQSFTGRDSITIKAAKGNALTWKTLVERVHKLGEAHQLEDFKTHFPGYAKFHFENDPVTVAALDALLFKDIKSGHVANVHLAAPEVLEFGSIEFSYNSNDDRFDDLVLTDLLASRRAFGDKSSIDSIKSLRVNVWNLETAQKIRDWSAYKCLVAELEYDGDSFILSNAQWKRVAQELKEEVTDYIKTVPVNQDAYLLDLVNIWDAGQAKDKESVFNLAVAAAGPNDLVLFDTAKIEIAGKRLYETCDLFHKEKKFIQVKRFSSGSASVSHLFVQGRFYAEAFLSDDKCREGMRKHIEAIAPAATKDAFLALIPQSRGDLVANTYTVVFCILSNTGAISLDDLPFMARYELMHTHRHLQKVLGMNCEVAFRVVVTGPAVAPVPVPAPAPIPALAPAAAPALVAPAA